MINFPQKIKVSVIVPSYNHKNFVEEALRSVLDQEIENMEVIVVDDASNDGTVDVIKNIKDDRINFIELKENRSKHPRNLALDIARGEFIAFQNSDDFWEKEKLKKQLEIMEKNDKIAVCFSGVKIIDEFGKEMQDSWMNNVFTTENRKSSLWLRRFFDEGNCLCISSALVRKSALKLAGNFRANLINLSDFDLWVRLVSLGEFHIIPEELTDMRIIGKSNLSIPSPENCRRTSNELMEILDRYLEPSVYEKLPEIFSDIIPAHSKSEVLILGNLAKHAWKLSPAHIYFGNKIIGNIMNDKTKREELVSIFGTEIIKEYIKNRGSLEMGKFSQINKKKKWWAFLRQLL